MPAAFDYRRFIVLVVDDEEAMLRTFNRAFGDTFKILTATNADEGLSILKQHKDEVGVLIADSWMPGHKGTWLLEQARDIKPHLVRIYWSCCCVHEDALLEACRIGIRKYILLPFDPPTMEQTLREALEQFALVDGLVPKQTAGRPCELSGVSKDVRDRSPEQPMGSDDPKKPASAAPPGSTEERVNSDGPKKSHMDHWLWQIYFKPALDKSKPWRDRLYWFSLGIRNGLCLFVCAVEIARRKPEEAEDLGDLGQRTAKSLSTVTRDFCQWVRQELASKVEEEPREEPGSSPPSQPAVPLDGNYVPWNIREETFRTNLQAMLDYSVSAVQAVRLKPDSAEAVVSKVTGLADRTSKLTQEFCAMVERDFVNKVEERAGAEAYQGDDASRGV